MPDPQNNGASSVALDADVNAAKEAAITLLPDHIKGQAATLIASGLFSDTKSVAQAIVKIEIGRALGINAAQAMADISVVQGRPFIGATLLAAAIKRSERYDYRVTKLDATECVIEFFDITGERPESVGISAYTMDDAKTAGMGGKDNYKKHPRNMLFARAISNGSRWFCPDAIGSAVYTFEELDDVASLPVESPSEAVVISAATDSQKAQIGGILDALSLPDDDVQMRLTKVGAASIDELTEVQAAEFIDGLNDKVAAHV